MTNLMKFKIVLNYTIGVLALAFAVYILFFL